MELHRRANEIWSRKASGEYVLKANGLCLDDPAYSTRNGTQLIVYTCKDTASQRWKSSHASSAWRSPRMSSGSVRSTCGAVHASVINRHGSCNRLSASGVFPARRCRRREGR